MENMISDGSLQKSPREHAIAHLTRWFDALSHEARNAGTTSSKPHQDAISESLKDHWLSLTSNTKRRAA
jgi:hypothetical protein